MKDDSRTKGQDSRPPQTEVLDQAALRELLRWASEREASDVLLCSNRPVHINRYGEYLPVAGRRIATWELSNVIDAIYMRSAGARLIGGEDLDFSYEFRLNRHQRLRFRANAVAIAGGGAERGIALTLRALPSQVPEPEDIDLPRKLLALIDDSRQGLILVTGATGSGKSTLLAACLSHTLRTPPGRYIVSYEAPIEFDLTQVPDTVGVVAQSEVPRDLPSFSRAIRNALRRAPDIILIGEARDRETLAGVVRAGQTGHLVYTTVHTNSVASTIPRMVDEFPLEERHAMTVKLIDSTRLIIYQRLVPRKQGGRIALREYLAFTPELRDRLLTAIGGKIPLHQLLRRALREHGQSLYQDAGQKHAQNHIDQAQFKRLCLELQNDE